MLTRVRVFLRASFFLIAVLAVNSQAQSPELQQILDRLDRLERANRALIEEVRALRSEQAAARNQPAAEAPGEPEKYLPERVAVQERRTEELAQAKVESSQKFPIQFTGMVLFNAFLNSRHADDSDNAAVASLPAGRASGGATLRQTVLGLTYRGPETWGGGKIQGSVLMDFFSSAGLYDSEGLYAPDSPGMRLRTASVSVAWKTRSVTVGQLKPLISPREPDSLAQVGEPPLSSAGNLWLWRPQVRFEQQLPLGERSGLRAQVGLLETSEDSAAVPQTWASTLEPSRPAIEGRFELSHRFDSSRRLEIAPGFHASTTHVAGAAVPSNVFSLDGLLIPVPKLEFSGAFFTGQNVANLGALGQGFRVLQAGQVLPVHSTGGWVQAAFLPTARLSFHFFAGQQKDRESDLYAGRIGRNRAYGANAMFRLAPNVIVAFETAQRRTYYIGKGTGLHQHYDLALAYLF